MITITDVMMTVNAQMFDNNIYDSACFDDDDDDDGKQKCKFVPH